MLVYCLIFTVLFLMIVGKWRTRKFLRLHEQLKVVRNYLPILQHAMIFLGDNEDIMKKLTEISQFAWKNKHSILSGWMLNKLFVVIADADKACTVLKATLSKSYVHNIGKTLVGEGSIFAPVEIWQKRRKILTPTFIPRNVNSFVPIFEAQSKVTADLMESNVGKGDIQCFEYFCRYSLDAVCETLFGVNIDVQRNPADKVFNAFIESQKIMAKRLAKPWLHIGAIYRLLPIYYREKRMVKIIHEFVNDLIQKKKMQLNNKKENIENADTDEDKSEPRIKSIVELLIENFSIAGKTDADKQLQEESIVLALAGSETAAIGVSFTILLLSQYQDIQDKVYKEIQDVLGNSDEPLSFESLQNLKYLKAVIKETLRLYPPAPFIMRHCDKDVVLAPDLTLPKDCNVLISLWGIQRNRNYWGEDVKEFNPDRFMSGPTNPNAFLAFSYGARNCIGQHYAMLSITTTLVTMLRRYRFMPATNFKYDKNNPIRLSYYIVIKHIGNFPVQVEYRDQYKEKCH